MKKFACLSLILVLLMQSLTLPASAAVMLDTTPIEQYDQTESTGASEEPPQESLNVQIPFGRVCIQQGCRTIEGMMPLGGNERKLDTSLGVFVYETNSDTVIYSYNPDVKLSPGTLAKLVTALLVAELCELDEVITVNTDNISRLPRGQIVDIRNGEQFTVEQLLYCLILHGANDAAVVLAEHVSGSMQGFTVLMNERVKQMGCTSTEFGNVHGLDNATSWTTARDMTRIMQAVYENEALAKILAETRYEIPETETTAYRELITTNYLIDTRTVTKYYDSRVKGGLASYSEASGASLACVAASGKLNVVCVVLGATREFNTEPGWTWQTLVYGNFDEMVDLLEYVFNTYKVNQILYDGQALYQFPVAEGESKVVGQPKVNISTVLPADVQMDNLIMNYSAVDGKLTAPIEKDEMIATVEVWYRNSCIAEAELFAMGSVKNENDTGVKFLNEAVGTGNKISGFWGFLSTAGILLLCVAGLYIGYNAFRRAQRRAQRRRRRAERRRSW